MTSSWKRSALVVDFYEDHKKLSFDCYMYQAVDPVWRGRMPIHNSGFSSPASMVLCWLRSRVSLGWSLRGISNSAHWFVLSSNDLRTAMRLCDFCINHIRLIFNLGAGHLFSSKVLLVQFDWCLIYNHSRDITSKKMYKKYTFTSVLGFNICLAAGLKTKGTCTFPNE